MVKIFNTELKVFDDVEPIENGDIVLGENWYLVKNQDEINSISESITGGGEVWSENGVLKWSGKAPTLFHNWNGTEWILDEVAKAEFKRTMQDVMREKIIAKRNEILSGGVFVPEFGKRVDTDATALSNYTQMKADFDLNGKDNEYTLIFSDYSFKSITFDEFKILWNAVKDHKEKCYENGAMHIALMMQEENPEEYDFSSFWQGVNDEK